MNLRQLKPASLIAVGLFIYNYLSACFLGWLANFTPAAYNIKTGNLQQFLSYWQSNGLSYLAVGLGYLLTFLILVGLITTLVLGYHDDWSAKNFWTALCKPKLYGFTLGLLVLMWPLNQLGFKFPLTNYLTIPETFITMLKSPQIWWAFWPLYILVLLLALRVRTVFYTVIVERPKKGHSLLKKSWHTTKGTTFKVCQNLITIVLQLVLVVALLVGGQWVLDQLKQPLLSVITTNICLALLAGCFYYTTARLLALFVLTSHDGTLIQETMGHQRPWLTGLSLTIVGLVAVGLSGKLLTPVDQQPLIIAHMGVTSPQDIPNSGLTLKKAHAAKPDYVEIDIQRTKDGQYVLSHDTTIKSIKGKDYPIKDYRWDQLKDIDYRVKGQTIHLTNFKDYLDQANALKQKVLVELKINDTIKTDHLRDFTHQYGPALTQNHAQIQSMNQNALARLAKYSKSQLGLLSPVNNTITASRLNEFYSIEYSSLVPQTVRQAGRVHKEVYAWTVNHPADVQTMYAYGVQGFITDHPKQTRKLVSKAKNNPHYAQVVWKSVVFQRSNF